MKDSVRKHQLPTQLPHTLNHHLGLYALAAGAAGAAMTAAPALEASVVYTPANIRLSNGKLGIDLNHDGVVDFYLSNKGSGTACCFYTRSLNVDGAFVGSSQNGVIGVGRYANALKAGQAIGPKQLFLFAPMIMATAFNDSNSFFFVNGPFANTTNRFLGLEFTLNGQKHYGWARFSVVKAGFNGSTPVVVATLTGYAYETDANEAIAAGQTTGATTVAANPAEEADRAATLGALALGASGLNLWRREEEMLAK
jgi:hypothetical protein